MSSWKKQSDNVSLPTLRGTFDTKTDKMFSQWGPKFWNLEADKLFYYRFRSDLEHLGVIELRDIVHVKQRAHSQKNNRSWVVEILCESGTTYIDMKDQARTEKWMNGLKKWIEYFERQVQQTRIITQPSNMLQDIASRNSTVGGSYGKKVLKSALGSDTDSSELTETVKDTTQTLQDKVELLEDWVQKQIMFIEEMGSNWSASEDRHQEEIKKLTSKFETKLRKFELLIERKDQILQERQMKWKRDQWSAPQDNSELMKKLKELEERNKALTEENEKLKKPAVHGLEDVGKLIDENISLKRKYFFALATGIKVMSVGKNGGKHMDLNNMYEKAITQEVPIDVWDKFILEQAGS